LACQLDAARCRAEHVAPRLDDAKEDHGDYETKCPSCGHGGFRVSRPATRMRHVWTCNCKICNGGKGCPAKVTRAAMLRKGIALWCLGSYIGKGKPEADVDRLLRIAQTVDDVINCCPALSASDITMLLAAARGDDIPDEYKKCAAYARGLGISRANSYNVAEKWAGGSGSRPSDSEVPPQTGGGSQRLKSYHAEAEPCQTPSSEAQECPTLGFEPSNSWTEMALDDVPDRPRLGQRTQEDKMTGDEAA
jgi:hypothetical protein